MTDDRESRFIAAARAALDRGTQQLDERTIARLRAARLRAIDARPRRRAWLATGGLATAALSAALVAFLLFAPAAPPPATGLEYLELLGENDGLELYRDLEFYRWLAEHADAA
jgi:hypothetical protein